MKSARFYSGSLGFRALVFIGTLFFTFKSFLKHKLVEIIILSFFFLNLICNNLLQANALAYRMQTPLIGRSLDCSLRYDMSAKFPRVGGREQDLF